MIDRRFFLKSLAGMGLLPIPVPGIGAKGREESQHESVVELMLPSVTLAVKVNEVAVHHTTREFDAIGDCLVACVKFPVEVRFFMAYCDPRSILPGFIYIMTGPLHLYPDEAGIGMIHPEFESVETVLAGRFLRELEQRFIDDDIPAHTRDENASREGPR